jgi:shikimate kinase
VFRDLEENELRSVLQESGPLIVAAGGGIVMRAANRQLLATVDQVIWLQASLDVLVQRVEARALRHEGHRPLVDGDPRARLRTLMAERQSLYEEVATAKVVVDDQSLEEVVTALTALVGPEGEL